MNLESLSLYIVLSGDLRDNGATQLFQGIEKVSVITNLALHLYLCDLRSAITNIAPALRNLITLKNLSLCIDFRHGGGQGPSGVIKLAEALKELTELQCLDLTLRWRLRANDTIGEAAKALVDGLKQLHNLSSLKLTLVQNGSCSEIASLFQFLTQLQELKLKWKSLGGKTDSAKLINGLKHLKQLRKLDMSWNAMEDSDVVPLVEALECINHLHTLDLSQNKIGDDGVELLAEAIENQHLTHLQVLDLSWNNFSEEGAKKLAKKVVKLSQLHTVDFGLKLRTYSARALVLIYQQKAIGKLHMLSNRSDETCHHFVAPFVKVVISALVAPFVIVVLFYTAFHLSPLLSSGDSNNRVLQPKGISEALAQGIFSTSSAWALERLRKQGLDGTGTVIVILDTAIDLSCPAFLQKNIRVIDCLPHCPIASTEHGSVCAAVAVGSSYNTLSTNVPSGVAPGAQLIVYRVAEGGYSYNNAVLRALDDIKVKTESGTQIDVVQYRTI